LKTQKVKITSPINVLLLTGSFWGGGAELVIANICRKIDKKKFNISVCHLKERGLVGEDLFNEGYDVFRLHNMSFYGSKYFSFLKVAKYIIKNNIKIVHTHTVDSLVEAAICKIILPFVKHIHTFHFGDYPNYEKKYMFLEKIFGKIPSKLIAVGHRQRGQILNKYNFNKKKIDIIWNGVDEISSKVDKNILKNYNINSDKKIIIGTMGVLIKQKGYTYLIDVIFELYKKRKDFILLIVGRGPELKTLKAKCVNLGLNNTVFFLGWVERAAQRILPIFDIFVQSSLWEAMSMVILEAMAAKKPIVTTNVGDNNLMINNGIDGFIVEPKDIKNMANSLSELINDKEKRVTFGQRIYKKYNQIGTIQTMVKNYEELYLNQVK